MKVDAAVVGAGPGGYACALRLAEHGLRAAIVEREFLGGICVNVGCIPSKALVHAASFFERMQHAGRLGIASAEPQVDVPRLMAWKRGVVEAVVRSIRERLGRAGVAVVRGEARIVGPRALDVHPADGGAPTRIEVARAIVVATGARPIDVPALPVDGERCLSYRAALELDRVPRHLVVVGGGTIGLEIGMAWAKLGARLTVVELSDSILPGYDPELVRAVVRTLKRSGADVFTRTRATGREARPDGSLALHLEVEGAPRAIECDRVLVSVGVRPASAGLGLEEAGVALDAKGHVLVDRQRRTNVPSILAVGDVSGPPYLAHKAEREGRVAADAIAHRPAERDLRALPAIAFTDPELATVGLTEAEARAQGRDVRIGRFPYAALGRALTLGDEGAPPGLIKVVSDARTGEVLGAHICGHRASELIAEAAHTIEMGGTAEDLALTVHPHPTLSEGMMEAAEAAHGKPIHVLA